ncbi:MAG: hypothetical protein ABFC94_13740 [Syntrophomonas sp.]
MARCNFCGAENEYEALICRECGGHLNPEYVANKSHFIKWEAKIDKRNVLLIAILIITFGSLAAFHNKGVSNNNLLTGGSELGWIFILAGVLALIPPYITEVKDPSRTQGAYYWYWYIYSYFLFPVAFFHAIHIKNNEILETKMLLDNKAEDKKDDTNLSTQGYKFRCRVNITSINIKKMLTVVGLITLMLFFLVPASIKSYTLYSLDELGSNKDSTGLESYIYSNCKDKENRIYVNHAVDVLTNIETENAYDAMEELMYSNLNNSLKIKIVKNLVGKNYSVKSVNKIYNLYEDEKQTELRSELKKLLALAPKVLLYEEINKKISQVKVSGNDFPKYFSEVMTLTPTYENEVREMVTVSIRKNLSECTSEDSFCGIEVLLDYWDKYGNADKKVERDNLLKAIDNYDSLDGRQIGIKNEIQKNNDKISSASQEIQKINNSESIYITLSAYMVRKIDDDNYEISLPQYNGYFGELPSSNHAILKTVSTTFQSKGWFTIKAISEGTMPVDIKEEYGGFTQDWPVYIEVPDSTLDHQNKAEQQQIYNEANNNNNKLKTEQQSNKHEINRLVTNILNQKQSLVSYI